MVPGARQQFDKMKPTERISLIKRIGKRLAEENWTDIDLVFSQFDVPALDWSGSDKYEYCVLRAKQASDSVLRAIGNHVLGTTDKSPPLETQLPWQANRFRLFVSHITADKKLASALKEHLALAGIDVFVAHQDIEATAKWLEQIESALATCDALAALLTNRFHESRWTDQEVGFCVSRRVLIIPVRFDIDPYGFISRYQAFTPSPNDDRTIAQGIFDIVAKHDLTAEKMGAALVSTFAESFSFEDAKKNLKLLAHVTTWTPRLLREIEQAVEKNRQVRDSFGVPEGVRAIVRKHGK